MYSITARCELEDRHFNNVRIQYPFFLDMPKLGKPVVGSGRALLWSSQSRMLTMTERRKRDLESHCDGSGCSYQQIEVSLRSKYRLSSALKKDIFSNVFTVFVSAVNSPPPWPSVYSDVNEGIKT